MQEKKVCKSTKRHLNFTESDSCDFVPDHISKLHDLCGIYTDYKLAREILQLIQWERSENLEKSKFLEPCAGDGSILVLAVRELIESFKQFENPLNFNSLSKCIIAFEIHPLEADKAKSATIAELTNLGLNAHLAERLAKEWIHTEDFLLTSIKDLRITHVATNPPYLRWSRIPSKLANAYRTTLPYETTRGDLCVAFIARIIDSVSYGTRIGILTSDRWLYAAYAEPFRTKWLSKVVVKKLMPIDSSKAFQTPVSINSLICVMNRNPSKSSAKWREREQKLAKASVEFGVSSDFKNCIVRRSPHRDIVTRWLKSMPSIQKSGCRIKVGPALGLEQAFVGRKRELRVEEELVSPFLSAREIVDGEIHWSGRWVLCVGSPRGGWINLSDYPCAEARLREFEKSLIMRSCVTKKEYWYKTIDRTLASDWTRNKILVPELKRIPQAVFDQKGFVPSHGIYAIFSNDWPTKILCDLLLCGILRLTIEAIAPQVSNGYFRCYKRFLSQIPLPNWKSLCNQDRYELAVMSDKQNRLGILKIVARIYDVNVKILDRYSPSKFP